MHMPEKSRGGRHYLFWDKMQLREGITGPHPTQRSAVIFELYRVFRSKVVWRSMGGEGIIFFHKDPAYPLEMIRQTCRQIRLQQLMDSVDVDAYIFKNSPLMNDYLQLDDEIPMLRCHPFHGDLGEFLDGLLEHRRTIRKMMREANVLDPENKKIQLIMLCLSRDEAQQAADDAELQLKIESLASSSADARIHLWLYCDDVDIFPAKTTLKFPLQFFIGPEEESFCKEVLHPGVMEGNESFYQERIGLAFDDNTGEMTPIHRRKMVPSKWLVEKERLRDEAEKQYREILKGLYDGS